MTIREALIAMGYRECKPGQWIKPVAYQAFSYHEGKSEWANWFRAKGGSVARWESKPIRDEGARFGSYLTQLKFAECYTRTDLNVNSDSQFELEAIDL